MFANEGRELALSVGQVSFWVEYVEGGGGIEGCRVGPRGQLAHHKTEAETPTDGRLQMFCLLFLIIPNYPLPRQENKRLGIKEREDINCKNHGHFQLVDSV